MILDDGYQFGLGAFETIAIHQGVPLFLGPHLARMDRTLAFLKIDNRISEEEVQEYLRQNQLANGGLKIMVSQNNIIFTRRKNPYRVDKYQNGAIMGYSDFKRNETSPLICHKTLNYGECILENRKAKDRGLDEIIFLNTKGEICEGTVSNIFFVRDGTIYTPEKTCGLLPGVIRDFVLENNPAKQTVIMPDDVNSYDECFITNSLMGIMPVKQLGSHVFSKRDVTNRIMEQYRKELSKQISK